MPGAVPAPASSMLKWWPLLLVGVLVSCGKHKPSAANGDGGSLDGIMNEVDGDGVAACLEQPNELPRPPIERLPCELIPPGLAL